MGNSLVVFFWLMAYNQQFQVHKSHSTHNHTNSANEKNTQTKHNLDIMQTYKYVMMQLWKLKTANNKIFSNTSNTLGPTYFKK